MSADSFHGQIEKAAQKYQGGKQHDFQDFIKVTENANGLIFEMKPTDFLEPNFKVSLPYVYKLKPKPLISNFIMAEFNKGSYEIVYKTSYQLPAHRFNPFNKCQNIQLNGLPEEMSARFTFKKNACGITQEKKNEIVDKILPLIPQSRRKFWMDLPMM
jgi:hypothetical protein